MSKRILKIGIIGQGRSGRDIHGVLVATLTDSYKIAAIADSMPERQQRAKEEYGCNAYNTWQEMVDQEQLDLVVNASPSHLHFQISWDLLDKGVNVLCEKPLAKTADEVEQLIEKSKTSGKVLAVFQNGRYSAAFTQIRNVIDSGVLGRIVQIDLTNSWFARRWDWQTLQKNNGGSLMNTGPHPLDQGLQLFGTDRMPQITCIMDRANTFGDAEDYVKLILRGKDRPTIDIEVSTCSAFPNEQFNIQGTLGGLHGDSQSLEWKYYVPAEAPQQQLIDGPLYDANGNPAYCGEELTWHTDKWEVSEEAKSSHSMTKEVYAMVYRTIVEGAELEITPQQVHQQMKVMEECRRQNPHIYEGNGDSK